MRSVHQSSSLISESAWLNGPIPEVSVATSMTSGAIFVKSLADKLNNNADILSIPSSIRAKRMDDVADNSRSMLSGAEDSTWISCPSEWSLCWGIGG